MTDINETIAHQRHQLNLRLGFGDNSILSSISNLGNLVTNDDLKPSSLPSNTTQDRVRNIIVNLNITILLAHYIFRNLLMNWLAQFLVLGKLIRLGEKQGNLHFQDLSAVMVLNTRLKMMMNLRRRKLN